MVVPVTGCHMLSRPSPCLGLALMNKWTGLVWTIHGQVRFHL